MSLTTQVVPLAARFLRISCAPALPSNVQIVAALLPLTMDQLASLLSNSNLVGGMSWQLTTHRARMTAFADRFVIHPETTPNGTLPFRLLSNCTMVSGSPTDVMCQLPYNAVGSLWTVCLDWAVRFPADGSQWVLRQSMPCFSNATLSFGLPHISLASASNTHPQRFAVDLNTNTRSSPAGFDGSNGFDGTAVSGVNFANGQYQFPPVIQVPESIYLPALTSFSPVSSMPNLQIFVGYAP